MGECNIGDNCIIGQGVFIAKDVSIGNKVKIQNNVSVYTGVIIEDDVFLGPSMVFTNVINPRSFIERKEAFKSTIVRRGATIGANATIICGIKIGQYAFIGAGAVVTKDVPDFGLITGNPGILTGFISKQGHKLLFDQSGKAVCPVSGEEYTFENQKISLTKK